MLNVKKASESAKRTISTSESDKAETADALIAFADPSQPGGKCAVCLTKGVADDSRRVIAFWRVFAELHSIFAAHFDDLPYRNHKFKCILWPLGLSGMDNDVASNVLHLKEEQWIMSALCNMPVGPSKCRQHFSGYHAYYTQRQPNIRLTSRLYQVHTFQVQRPERWPHLIGEYLHFQLRYPWTGPTKHLGYSGPEQMTCPAPGPTCQGHGLF